MITCRHCGAKFTEAVDSKCPQCGEKLVIKSVKDLDDRGNAPTIDESIVNHIEETTEEDLAFLNSKAHSKVIAFLLGFFLGFTGAEFYYLGFYLKGVIWVILCVAVVCAFGLLGLSVGIGMICVFLMNMCVSLGFLLRKNVVDANGRFLE